MFKSFSILMILSLTSQNLKLGSLEIHDCLANFTVLSA